MAFQCPSCTATGSLVITHSIELPEDLSSGSDELSLQAIACNACGFLGVAVYEESRRGASESVHHYGYRAAENEVKDLVALIESCAARSDPRCGCRAHALCGARDAEGRWQPPVSLRTVPTFSMRWVPDSGR